MSSWVDAGASTRTGGGAPATTAPRVGDQIRSPGHRLSRRGGQPSIERGPAHVPPLRELPRVDQRAAARAATRRDALFRRLLAVADLAAAGIALLLVQLLTGSGWYPLELYLGIPLVVLLSKMIGLYDRDELVVGKTSLADAPGLFQLATISTLLIVAVADTTVNQGLGTGGTLELWGLLFVGGLLARAGARWSARALTPRERCVVLGHQEQADRVQAKFASHESLHTEIVAFLPYEAFELRRARPAGFATYVAERGIDRVIVGQSESRDRLLETVRYFKEHDLKVSVLPDLLEVVGSSVEFDEVHGTTLLGIRSFGLSRSSAILKRTFDLAGATLLLVLLSPFLAAIVLAIKLDSPGPVFFNQTRVGRDGERFTMRKFRTMFEGSDQLRDELLDDNQTEGVFKLVDDPRVTRVGRFLRSSSLDELPQLFNVLGGQMSLVGPRPLVVEEDAQVEGWHRRRLHLTPGMTGAWQIMGQTRVPLREMVSMDYLYIVNWSLWADVKILLQTAGHVLRRRGL